MLLSPEALDIQACYVIKQARNYSSSVQQSMISAMDQSCLTSKFAQEYVCMQF